MNARRRISRAGSSVAFAISLLAAMQGSRAEGDEAATQDSGVAHTGVTWRVANNGVDSPDCGSRRRPCRTITQGIENSEPGDLVLVGPGLYGDLNGSCTFDVVPEEGEEFGNTICDTPTRICLNKEITVASVEGAEATVIDACGYPFGVVIRASNSRFGLPHRGFTIIDATSAAVALGAPSSVTVAGNIIRPDPLGNGIQVESGQDHRLVSNLARDGESGFVVLQLASGGVRVTDNVAISNNRAGFRLLDQETLVARNVAIGNGFGFEVHVNGQLFRLNSIIGNRQYGIVLHPFTGTSVDIRRSNIFGNNDVPRDGNVNCGILNETNLNVNATNNFWGAPTGPGANPADDACDIGGGQIIHTPFATKQFPLRHKPTLLKSTVEDVDEGDSRAQ